MALEGRRECGVAGAVGGEGSGPALVLCGDLRWTEPPHSSCELANLMDERFELFCDPAKGARVGAGWSRAQTPFEPEPRM